MAMAKKGRLYPLRQLGGSILRPVSMTVSSTTTIAQQLDEAKLPLISPEAKAQYNAQEPGTKTVALQLRWFPKAWLAPVLLAAAVLQWWFFNVVTIILNKYIFAIMTFRFPMTLTMIHFSVCSACAYLVLRTFQLKPLTEVMPGDRLRKILPMASVFCANIVMGNLALRHIPVSFMQTVKSFTPAATVMLQSIIWRKQFGLAVYLSLLPIVGGIALTSATEVNFVWFGFIAAFLDCFLAGLKTIMAEVLLQGKYSFDSINTVYHMAPIAAAILAPFAIVLEGPAVTAWFRAQLDLTYPISVLAGSGLCAFALNYSIFFVIQTTSAVSFNVAGNMKTAVAIFFSWLAFHNPMSVYNWVGCSITIVGCTIYGFVRSMQQKASNNVSNSAGKY
eukprot:jgi/Chlat1/5780/Chrsp387S05506